MIENYQLIFPWIARYCLSFHRHAIINRRPRILEMKGDKFAITKQSLVEVDVTFQIRDIRKMIYPNL